MAAKPQFQPLELVSSFDPGKVNKAHTRRLRLYVSRTRPSASDDMTDLDLEVMGLIEIDRRTSHFEKRVTVTTRGRAAIYDDRQAKIAAQSPHHELASRLAACLRSASRLAWENVEFKAEFGINDSCHVRPDVFSIAATHNHAKLAPAIHEVKISRADFLSDIAKPKKRQAYRQIAGCMVYVVPAGLIEASEVPEECGLLIETAPGVFVQKKRPLRTKKFLLSSGTLINLVLKSNGSIFDSVDGPDCAL